MNQLRSNKNAYLYRRAFLKAAGHGCAALAVYRLPDLAASTAQAQGGWAGPVTPTTIPSDILHTSARNLARLIREKKVSSVEVVSAYLKQIERVNPPLNAVVLVCAERALREAREADAALQKKDLKGPLHGVPFTIEDSFDTAGVVSTGGTLGRKNYMPSRDATVVARLRQAGAILLGKTNVGELSLSDQTDNLIFRRTFNPYDLQRSPGGSSGGAAAIIAAGGSPLDIGSDIAGGIRGPAHFCGIAALKPTVALVPRTGHVIDYGGICDPYQQIGPMARWAEDLSLVLPLIIGPDYSDAGIAPVPLVRSEEMDLTNLKLAFYTDNGTEPKPTAQTVEAVTTAVQLLGAAGLPANEDCPKDLFTEAEEIRAKYDGADDRAWVRRLLDKHKTKSASPSLPLGGKVVTSAEFTHLAERLDGCRSKLLQWLVKYDVVLCPAFAHPAPAYREEPSGPPIYPKDYGYTGISNLTGWPAAVVRAGGSPDGLPIAVQVVGRPWREDVVLAVAQLIESRTGGWKPPAYTKGRFMGGEPV